MVTTKTSAALKREIENRLAAHIPRALSPLAPQAPRLLNFRIQEIKALLGGGLPLGAICELTGPASAGLTSISFSILSEATIDSACAYIDPSDTLDPKSAAAAGVQLQNLLWVRFASVTTNTTQVRMNGAKTYRQEETEQPYAIGYGGRSHPRYETKGLDRALKEMLVEKGEARLKKAEGTPGYPNQKLSLLTVSEEQVSYEHFNARRADASDPLRRMDQRAADAARERARPECKSATVRRETKKPLLNLEKAIRAADQVLHAGGFRVIVLDLASAPSEQALRIPSATWFRFRRAAQDGDAILLLLTQQPCAQSSAACVVQCFPRFESSAVSNVFGSLHHSAEVIRQRSTEAYGKKAAGRVAQWEAAAPWMRAVGK